MGVIVTGGAGYIGSNICKQLELAGFRPIIIDNFSTSSEDSINDYEHFKVDILDRDKLIDIFERNNPRAVIHAAALTDCGASSFTPDKYWLMNVQGTRHVAEAMRKVKAQAMIYSSSAAVYGDSISPRKEWDQPNPLDPYGSSKLLSEIMLRDFFPGFSTMALRLFNVAGADVEYGLGDGRPNRPSFISRLVEHSLTEEPLTINGHDYTTLDGTPVRDYVHVTDVAIAHVKALQIALGRQHPGFQAINIGSGGGRSLLEVVEVAKNEIDMDVSVKFGTRREGDPMCLVANVAKAREVLDWFPENSDLPNILETELLWQT